MDILGGGGGPQTRPIANSAPNPLGPYCQNLGELYQRQYTCTYLSVAEGVLKNLQDLKCEVLGCNCVLLSYIL